MRAPRSYRFQGAPAAIHPLMRKCLFINANTTQTVNKERCKSLQCLLLCAQGQATLSVVIVHTTSVSLFDAFHAYVPSGQAMRSHICTSRYCVSPQGHSSSVEELAACLCGLHVRVRVAARFRPLRDRCCCPVTFRPSLGA